MKNKKVLAISGSTRKLSTNYKLIKAIEELSKEYFQLTIFQEIDKLPHFNPDINEETTADEVNHFRQLLNDANGVIICTPEYAHGVPGSLKNVIDWTVSSCEFSHKPTMLITASTDGQYGHKALLETLKVIEAKDVDQLQLLISFARTKINDQYKITDEETLIAINALIVKMAQSMNQKS